MPTFDRPIILQAALVTATHTSILDYRYALADKIEQVRHRTAAAKHAAASILLTTKPVKDWTPDDHLLFMEASGDHRMPDGMVAKPIPPHYPPTAIGADRHHDTDVPF